MKRRDVWDDFPGALLGCCVLFTGIGVAVAAVAGAIWLVKQVF